MALSRPTIGKRLDRDLEGVELRVLGITPGELRFEEFPASGYAGRTRKNASADVTIAIARDETTAGERLTKKSVLEQERTFMPLDYWETAGNVPDVSVQVVRALNQTAEALGRTEITLNMAGNGIYTLKETDQATVDARVLRLMDAVVNHPDLKAEIVLVRSGGQTGIDEVGVKAAVRLGIPALVTAPKGWAFRGADGKDVADEAAFKDRFAAVAMAGGEVPSWVEPETVSKLGPSFFSRLREEHKREQEDGPRLDAEWVQARTDGVVPVHRCEAEDALLTGDTFPLRRDIDFNGGSWKGKPIGWLVPAFGADFATRKNFRLVEGRQAFLDSLAAQGIQVEYRKRGM